MCSSAASCCSPVRQSGTRRASDSSKISTAKSQPCQSVTRTRDSKLIGFRSRGGGKLAATSFAYDRPGGHRRRWIRLLCCDQWSNKEKKTTEAQSTWKEGCRFKLAARTCLSADKVATDVAGYRADIHGLDKTEANTAETEVDTTSSHD